MGILGPPKQPQIQMPPPPPPEIERTEVSAEAKAAREREIAAARKRQGRAATIRNVGSRRGTLLTDEAASTKKTLLGT